MSRKRSRLHELTPCLSIARPKLSERRSSSTVLRLVCLRLPVVLYVLWSEGFWMAQKIHWWEEYWREGEREDDKYVNSGQPMYIIETQSEPNTGHLQATLTYRVPT